MSKAALQGKPHHLSAKTATNIGYFTNPNINCSQIILALSPVVTLISCSVNDLQKDNRKALYFSNQLLSPIWVIFKFSLPAPVSSTLCCRNMRGIVPSSKQSQITRLGWTQLYCWIIFHSTQFASVCCIRTLV